MNRALVQFLEHHFQANWSDLLDQSYEDFVYFITLKPSDSSSAATGKIMRNWHRRLESAADYAFKEFDGFYAKLCMSTMPGRITWRSQRVRKPLTLAWLDFAGSRFPNGQAASLLVHPHVHAIAMIYPDPEFVERVEQFRRPDNLEALAKRWRNVSSIQMEKFDPARATLEDLTSYACKFERRTDAGTWRIYPD